MQKTISKPVGKGGGNLPSDVKTVQLLLNGHIGKLTRLSPLSIDGKCGKCTIAMIVAFQKHVVRIPRPDGRVDPGGKTLAALNKGVKASTTESKSGTFSHPDAEKVTLKYQPNARKMNAKAEHLLKSILGSCGIWGATLTSTTRTYHDQARITITQTYKKNPANVAKWYGQDVLTACKQHLNDIGAFAKWWEERDKKRQRVSSRHLSNQALDVVPNQSRQKFAAKAKALVPVKGSGVKRIIQKGEMGEPVDHVEFTFPICSRK